MDIYNIKKKLKQGEYVAGPFVRMAEQAIIEMIGYAGFDFIIIDLEHGPLEVYQAENLVRTARMVGISPIIRVRENSETMILRALDTGAAGVQIPQINSEEMAAGSVKASYFHPKGNRGVCRFTHNAEYSNIPRDQYFKMANENTLVVLQVEGKGGVENIDAILDTPDIDVLFLGPYDLSQALNLTGQVSHPEVLKTIETITKKARNKGIAVGSFADTPENIKRQKDMGIQYLSTYIDTGIFYESSRKLVEEIKAL